MTTCPSVKDTQMRLIILKNVTGLGLRFLPSQQKMAQKIMKMIHGDYIEKPDFALKSIGT